MTRPIPAGAQTLTPEQIDLLPLETFLVGSGLNHKHKTESPQYAMRLVRPNNSKRYEADRVSPAGRLLYYFWRATINYHPVGALPSVRSSGRSEAVKRLGIMTSKRYWRWVVQPGEPGYAELEGFKILCDHRRGQEVSPALLYRALGLDLSH